MRWVALVLLAAACGAPAAPACYLPPYENLGQWAPSPAALIETCSVDTGALVEVAAGAARVLARPFYAEPGCGLQVLGYMRVVAGVGRLEAVLWDDERGVLARVVPGSSGNFVAYGVAVSDETQVRLLGYAQGNNTMTFEVRDVLLAAIEWRR